MNQYKLLLCFFIGMSLIGCDSRIDAVNQQMAEIRNFIITLPSGVMLGVTSKLRVALINSVLGTAVAPAPEEEAYGICVPASIFADCLSAVITFGVEMTSP